MGNDAAGRLNNNTTRVQRQLNPFLWFGNAAMLSSFDRQLLGHGIAPILISCPSTQVSSSVLGVYRVLWYRKEATLVAGE